MSRYRRFFVPGGMYFFTIVTYDRQPLFADAANIQRLRSAIAEVQRRMPFQIGAAVVLPDHMHFIWTLPQDDDQYSKRIGLMKVSFTRSLRGKNALPANVSDSRRKHRESDVWQRRFWEHTIDDENELEHFCDYIHYNPVKHGYVSCPHLWEASSFHHCVQQQIYPIDWGCCCDGRDPEKVDFSDIGDVVGE